jgi:hypothetical protein
MQARTLIMVLTLCCWGRFTPLPAADSEQALQARELGQEARVAAERPLIHVHNGRLSVRLRRAPWAAVLPDLVRHTGIRMTATGALTGTLTQEFAALPLEQGLRLLFREVNLLMLFAATGSAVTLTHVWLFPKADQGAGPPETPGARGPLAKALAGPAQGTRTHAQRKRRQGECTWSGSMRCMPPPSRAIRVRCRTSSSGPWCWPLAPRFWPRICPPTFGPPV